MAPRATYNLSVDHALNIDAIVLEPPPAAWQRALSHAAPDSLSEVSRAFRESLGLPPDRPIVMSGHQAEFWHPGIFAKFVAMHAAAEAFGAQPVWLVVDSDINDPAIVRYPIHPRGVETSRLHVRAWRVDGATPAHSAREARVPTGRSQPVRGAALPPDADLAATPGVRSGLERIASSLRSNAGAPTLAAQFGRAAIELAEELTGFRGTRVIMASDVARTEAFVQVVGALKTQSVTASATYNAAVARHPGSRVAPLAEGELPLWCIDQGPGSIRHSARDHHLGSVPVTTLAPKALLLTGLLRAFGCDLFIHGMGGAGSSGEGGYDHIAAEWFNDWLGLVLAPMVMATATLRLDLPSSAPSQQQIERDQWIAHAARHHPGLVGDTLAEQARQSTLARLNLLRGRRDPDARRERLAAYRELHASLAASRERHHAALVALASQAAKSGARRQESRILADRTWAFPLYEPRQLQELTRQVRERFG